MDPAEIKEIKKMKKVTRKILISLLALALIVQAGVFIPFATFTANADTGEPQDVLCFSSDVHNSSGNASAERLGNWIDNIRNTYGHIDVMGFCGDTASSGASESDYWTYAQAVMAKMDAKGVASVFTTGNHEYSPGNYIHEKNITTARFIEDSAAPVEGNYHIYCIGSASNYSSYSDEQMTALTRYFGTLNDDKPVFIVTHYPLHTWSSRTTRNAGDMIDTLNTFAMNGTPFDKTDDKKIVFLWGHNHSESDDHYDEVFAPGRTIEYESGSRKRIEFYYCGAGCMSDSEYSSGSASVKGKGLVVTIGSDKRLNFTYYNAYGDNVTEPDGQTYIERDPIPVNGISLSESEIELETGEETRLAAQVDPADADDWVVLWSSSDPSVATVDEDGNITGVGEGTAIITAMARDGGYTADCTVAVVPAALKSVSISSESEVIEINESTKLEAEFDPAYFVNKAVIWTSSNEAVATVDSEGNVTGVSAGTAVITVTAEEGGKTANITVTVADYIESSKYVILYDGVALSSEEADDHLLIVNGTNQNTYYGLQGVNYYPGREPDDSILWTLTSVPGEDNTYYIQNTDGRYLNATYDSTGPIRGHLKLDDVKDKWILDGTLGNTVISGSMLQSTNASGSRDIYMAYETQGTKGDVKLFTIRSKWNADTIQFENPDISFETCYEETSGFSDGGEYILAVGEGNTVAAVKNLYGTPRSIQLSVNEEDGFIHTEDAGVVWTCLFENDLYRLTNNSQFLSIGNQKMIIDSAGEYAVFYTAPPFMYFRYTTNESGSYYYLNYSNGMFDVIKCNNGSAAPEGAASVRLFGKKIIAKFNVKWVNENGELLYSEAYEDGRIPVYGGENLPAKAENMQYTYTFSGWTDGTKKYGPDEELPAVAGPQVYTALFDKVEKHYTDGWAEDPATGKRYYYIDDIVKTGWHKDDGKWYYLDPADGGAMMTGWVKDGGKWYYMNGSGVMQTGWVKVGAKWYYMNSSGAMAVGWVKDGDKWYYMNSSGAMAVGWVDVGGTWYYMSSGGAMLTGWQQIDGIWYFFKNSGAMAANEWCVGYWLNANGSWTYQAKGSWQKNNQGWWFGDTSGWFAKNTTQKIDDVWYKFNAAGYWVK